MSVYVYVIDIGSAEAMTNVRIRNTHWWIIKRCLMCVHVIHMKSEYMMPGLRRSKSYPVVNF